ncbi:sugar-specific transcriptional regulator TrmB [Halonotius terrestris]|jgi:predicted transcriptional regulator|uniref:Sugar-specific transcriptional regulator TrmB n=1 Tax=Halonotius terrestris TaxID=2487750 RepID=A0A8J8PA71_9EURY|nr:sugar-specific transcriptional regulator TrmB [Halonotius terrestris]TQQ78360.1 sugar-specific transcriptional regulator TrmB [Halonotius terrestris]
MSETDAADGPPPFEDAFASDDVEQRIYGTILQTREPTAASAIADSADCDPKTARKYLGWFDDLGIVTRHDGHPATYERNDAYFEWRRINQLAADHSVEDLQNRVRELTTRITEYEETYDAASPAAVDAVAAAEGSDERTIDNVYSDLGDWATAREERDRYERARQQRTGGEREQASG